MGERIFADDWRACQEEHLRAVIAAGDPRNEATLLRVMQDIGFDEARLAELGAAQDAHEPGASDATEGASPASEPAPVASEENPAVDVDLPPEEEAVTTYLPRDEVESPPEEEVFADDPPDEADESAQLSLF